MTAAQRARRQARIEKQLTAALADIDALIAHCKAAPASDHEARAHWAVLARAADRIAAERDALSGEGW